MGTCAGIIGWVLGKIFAVFFFFVGFVKSEDKDKK